jgi:hypothetical protein
MCDELITTALEQVITAAECSQLLGVESSVIRRACERGQVAARKSGGTWLILKSDAEYRWRVAEPAEQLWRESVLPMIEPQRGDQLHWPDYTAPEGWQAIGRCYNSHREPMFVLRKR